MRLVRRFGAPRRRRDVDEHAATLDLHRECRHAILFVSRLADTGTAMELPTVPRTSDVIAVETAFAERPTDVVADIRHRTELSVLERDRNGGGLRLSTLQRGSRQVLGAAAVYPVLFIGHGVRPMLVLLLQARCRIGAITESTAMPRRPLAQELAPGALFPLPRPPAFYFKHQGPTEKGANQHEASEQAETRECQLQRDRLHDVGRHQDLEAEQRSCTHRNAARPSAVVKSETSTRQCRRR